MLHRYIGDRAFYRRVLAIAIPIIIQNGITNLVSLLDNVMVGQVGTTQMAGVSIANQLIFVFNLCIFGASSGAGIFTAQFRGAGDHEGIRHTFRFKLLVCSALSLLAIGLFFLGGEGLIHLYLTGEGDPLTAARTLGYGLRYLRIMLLGLLPFALTNAYSSTLRETGQTTVPMIAGVCAVLVNLVFNYILIFGHFGVPALGVQGAAIATVISRYAELAIVAIWTHTHKERNPFIRGAYRSMYIPRPLLGSIVKKGMPLLMNEFLWSTGTAFVAQCYSTCGLEVMPAITIANTVQQLCSVVHTAIGNAVGIYMGQLLGSRAPEDQVRNENRKLLALTVFCGAIFGGLLLSVSHLFPMLYNTADSVRSLAGSLICVSAVMMPFNAYTFSTYFTLRSGGQTMVTFLFDSCFIWAVNVPLAFCLSRFTGLPILPLYAICQSMDLLRCILGSWMIRRGSWIRNLAQ